MSTNASTLQQLPYPSNAELIEARAELGQALAGLSRTGEDAEMIELLADGSRW